MASRLPIAFALSILGCGSSSGLPTDDGSLVDCRVVDRFTFLENDGIVMAVATREDEIGVLWRESSERNWRLFFGTFSVDDPAVREPVEVGVIPSTTQVGLQQFGDGFALAWVDFEDCVLGTGCPDDAARPGRVHVTTIADSDIVSDVVIEGSLPGHVALGVDDGDLAVIWEEDDFEADRARLTYATSHEGEAFDEPKLLHDGPGSFGGVRVAPSRAGLAVTWTGGGEDESVPMLAFIDHGDVSVEPVVLGDHQPRTSDLRIASSDEMYGIATIEHDDVDRFFFSVVDLGGRGQVREISIAPGFVPWDIDVAWGGTGWALVAGGYLDPEGDGEPLLFLQQVDAAGVPRLVALDVAGEPAGEPHIVPFGEQRYVITWRTDRLRGALVDCAL